jgi:hypothetical protein
MWFIVGEGFRAAEQRCIITKALELIEATTQGSREVGQGEKEP